MKKGEARAAAEILRAILGRIEHAELTASRRVRARLEGAVMALEAATGSVRRAQQQSKRKS